MASEVIDLPHRGMLIRHPVSGKRYMVLDSANDVGLSGMWFICDADDPNARPILRDRRFIQVCEKLGKAESKRITGNAS